MIKNDAKARKAYYDKYIRNKKIKRTDIFEYCLINNIPYKEIDQEILNLTYCLNKIGLKTKSSRIGYLTSSPSIIIFEDDVTDKQIYNFVEFLSKNLNVNIINSIEILNFGRNYDDKFKFNWVIKFGMSNTLKYNKYTIIRKIENAIIKNKFTI